MMRADAIPSPLRGGPTRGEAPSGVRVAGMELFIEAGLRRISRRGTTTRSARLGPLRLLRHSDPVDAALYDGDPHPARPSAESALPARGREEVRP